MDTHDRELKFPPVVARKLKTSTPCEAQVKQHNRWESVSWSKKVSWAHQQFKKTCQSGAWLDKKNKLCKVSNDAQLHILLRMDAEIFLKLFI